MYKKQAINKRITAFVVFLGLMISCIFPAGPVYAAADGVAASAGNTQYDQGGAAATIDSTITLTGFASDISGASVAIRNFKAGDQLAFANNFGITGSYDAGTGILTLSGTTSSANYQSALRTVTFSTSSANSEDRIIDFSIGSGLYNSGNGHFYEFVSALNISWNNAVASASAMSLYGRTGYLVTITDASENAFVTEKVEGLGWIGAKDIHYVNAASDDNLGDWRWVTGPEGTAAAGGTQFFTGYNGASPVSVGYENWWAGEPNNGGDLEYVAHIFGPVATMPGWAAGAQPGEWNDFEPGRSDGAVKGFIVEYGGMAGDTPMNLQSSKTVNITPARVLSYNGNGNTGGSVPGNSSYADNTAATVSGNSGNLVKTGKSFAGWNTTSSGVGTTYYPGDTFTITANTTLYAIWADESTIDCSAGASSLTVGNASGAIVDSGLAIGSGAMLTGAKATITTGFDSVNDALSFTATANISGSYDTAKGTLTLTGNASPAEYQTALRSVAFKTSSSAVGTRTVVFSLGNKLAYGNHYYEYVNNGGNITWTAAKTAAEARSYYGQSGYLATITSQEENDFLAQKLAADAWIGASDATTEGAWYWVTGPESGTLFYTGVYTSYTTYAGIFTNWANNQPDNWIGIAAGEDYGEMYCSGANPGKWNDLPNNESITGYLVEYNSAVGASDSKDVSIIAASTGSSRNNNSTQISGVPVIVNGQIQSAGKQTESVQNGVRTAAVDVDETIVSAKIDSVLAANQQNPTGENIIEVPVSTDADNIKVALTGDIVKKMDDNGFTLNVSYDNVSYLIPAEEIKINDLAAQLGAGKLTDIEIKVEFQVPDTATLAKIAEQAQAKDYEIVIPPLNFEVFAVNTATSQQTAVSRFTNYVERMFEIPSGVDPAKITTGIVYNADGTFSHIPTAIIKVGDKYYAKLNSLSNSTYSVIWNPVIFKDMENHWARAAADNLGSRLVVSGVGDGKFDPNRAITRGEFAAIITKALGIYRTGVGTDQFGDVLKTNIFYDAISIADDYGLITGYTTGLYEPSKSITREEAMAILTRAADIVKLEKSSGTTIDGFTDAAKVSAWARAYVKANIEKGIIIGNDGLVRPQDDISRAEVVTAIERILKDTELISSER